MIVILLSWLYILFTSVVVGVFTAKIIKINTQSSVNLSILGLFTTCIFGFSWAFFNPINQFFYSCYLVFVFINSVFYKKELVTIVQNKINFLKKNESKLVVFGVLFVFLLSVQTATKPTLPDNESYYLQTIKWINEFGFVKGLGNLHLFFAQTSGWHVLQSIYNFYFLSIPLASLSGFISFLSILFCFDKLHFYFKERKKLDLIFGLFPLFIILFFPLINVPSPDVATYCISIPLFYLFLNPTNDKESSFKLLVLYAGFLTLIKITNAPLLLIPLLYFLIEKKVPIKTNKSLLTLILFTFVLLFAKNALITGYLFYPIHSFGVWNEFYKIPSSVLDYFFSFPVRYNFFIETETLKNSTNLFIFKQWLFKSYSDMFFNASVILCFLVLPFIIIKEKKNYKIWLLYAVLLLQFILLVFSSPQYRFFLGSLLFFFAVIASYLLTTKRKILICMSVSLLILSTDTFLPQAFGLISSNKIITSRSAFSLKNLWKPEKTSSLKTDFIVKTKQKLHYYSPSNSDLFWQTGTGQLPCVSQKQLEYFETNFKIIPQPIGNNLQDGFYAKKITKP